MKVDYTTEDGRMHVVFEATSQVDLFKQIARFQEVFEDTECVSKDGQSSNKVRFQVRTDNEGNEYFELVCVDSTKPKLRFAKKKFGQHKGKDQTLFPKSGWVKWDKDKKEEVEL